MGEQLKKPVTRFTDLEVWRKSHSLFLQILADLDRIPVSRTSSFVTEQLLRSLGSIGANIAEGFNRSRAKYLNSLEIALGEANEAENWLYKLRDAGQIAEEMAIQHIRELLQIQKMLSALRRSIRQTKTP